MSLGFKGKAVSKCVVFKGAVRQSTTFLFSLKWFPQF